MGIRLLDAVNIFSSSESRYCFILLRIAWEYPIVVLTFSSGMSHGDGISVLNITHKRQARLDNRTTNIFRKIEFSTRRRHLSRLGQLLES